MSPDASEPIRTPLRRFATKCAKCLVAFSILLVSVVVWNAVHIGRLYREARRDSAALLVACGSDEARLDAATGRLGVVFRINDGSWIAVFYTDSHSAMGFYSCAVARCSDGTWLQSDHHFCGEFAAYRGNKEWLAQATTDDERAAVAAIIQEEALHAVESAQDLLAAKARLRERGFRDFTPSADLLGSAPPAAPTPAASPR